MKRLLIGILSLTFAAFAWPSQQGYFGAQLGPADGSGATIITVLPESPAERAGFQIGDVLFQVENHTVEDAPTLADFLRRRGAGANVSVHFERNDKNEHTVLTLGTNPWQNADSPDAAMTAVKITTDVSYGADEKQALDLYQPEAEAPTPLLLWIHGGGWSTGDRSNERALALRFAERGIAVAAMSYRLSAGRWAAPELPETGVTHPEHVRDVASAFAWLRENAARLNLDANAMFVSGHSSGGHLAALLASDPTYLSAHSLGLETIAGALPVGGAYDIPDYHAVLTAGEDPDRGRAHIHAVFGTTVAQWKHASPTEYLADATVPMLVVVEEQPAFQRYAERLREAAEAAGRSDIELYHADRRTHGNVILLMSGRHKDTVRARMIRFIQDRQTG